MRRGKEEGRQGTKGEVGDGRKRAKRRTRWRGGHISARRREQQKENLVLVGKRAGRGVEVGKTGLVGGGKRLSVEFVDEAERIDPIKSLERGRCARVGTAAFSVLMSGREGSAWGGGGRREGTW